MRWPVLIAAAALAACDSQPAHRTAQSGSDSSRGLSSEPRPLDRGADANSSGSEPAASDRSKVPGQWFSRDGPEGRWAGFGPPFSEAAFSARCESGRVLFNVLQLPPSGVGPTEMRLSAQGLSQTIPARASDEGLPNTEAPVPTGADWLSRLASAPGNLKITAGDGDPLTVPIGEPLRALIRACAR